MANLIITHGPSKWDLMLGLFDGDSQHRRTIEFSINDTGPSVKMKLMSLMREDGSGELWIFTGYAFGETSPVKGFYSTRDRTGFIER